mmetsp:Transcript_7254/g.17948  ORF Transcript_7254/g.17948 Transcript_7254/m.17948 type:complete len:208 (-) Transcript_7254:725-1348(-)
MWSWCRTCSSTASPSRTTCTCGTCTGCRSTSWTQCCCWTCARCWGRWPSGCAATRPTAPPRTACATPSQMRGPRSRSPAPSAWTPWRWPSSCRAATCSTCRACARGCSRAGRTPSPAPTAASRCWWTRARGRAGPASCSAACWARCASRTCGCATRRSTTRCVRRWWCWTWAPGAAAATRWWTCTCATCAWRSGAPPCSTRPRARRT